MTVFIFRKFHNCPKSGHVHPLSPVCQHLTLHSMGWVSPLRRKLNRGLLILYFTTVLWAQESTISEYSEHDEDDSQHSVSSIKNPSCFEVSKTKRLVMMILIIILVISILVKIELGRLNSTPIISVTVPNATLAQIDVSLDLGTSNIAPATTSTNEM